MGSEEERGRKQRKDGQLKGRETGRQGGGEGGRAKEEEQKEQEEQEEQELLVYRGWTE